jgi:Rap1a immunity proteins/Glycine-zipper domain
VKPLTLAPAAVMDAEFPPNTVRELIAICAPDKDDPRMTASVNFCHGFVEGAVIVEEANETHKGARKLFCLPSPRLPRGSELTNFIAWANQQPGRLDMPSIDGVFLPGGSLQQAESAIKKHSRGGGVSDAAGCCSDMSTTQQRALSGTAIGAGSGAIIGAKIAGNAGLGAGIGAAAGLAGGLIFNKVKQDQAASYNAGYQVGASRQPPNPPQQALPVIVALFADSDRPSRIAPDVTACRVRAAPRRSSAPDPKAASRRA